jgi:hypothetical protein
LDESYGIGSHLVCFVAKFEEGGETRNVMGGIYERQSEIEGLNELEIYMAKFKNIDLGKGR